MVFRLFPALAVFLLSAQAQQIAVIGHKHADSVGFYDAGTGALLATVPVGVRPHEMAESNDGRYAYVTNYGLERWTETIPGGNTISILDLAARRRVGDIDLGSLRRPHGIEMAASGRLYVTCDMPPAVVVVDPVKRTVIRSVPIGEKSFPHMVAVSRDERKAYTANAGSGTIAAVNLATGAVKHIQVGGIPMGVVFSPDEKRVYAATRTANTVAVIDTALDTVVSTVEVSGHPVRLRITPDGKTLIVTNIDSGDVAIIDTATLIITKRFLAGTNAEGLQLDPSGKHLYVSAQGDAKVIKYSVGDWKRLLEVKTAVRPDPILIIPARP